MAKEEAEAAAKAIELRDKYSELQEMNNRIKELEDMEPPEADV